MDESEQPGSFKVKDKRRFTSEGEAKQDGPNAAGTAGEGAAAQEEVSSQRAGGPDSQAETKAEKEQAAPPPPLDFSALILSLANTALFQLGFVKSPDGSEIKKDLEGARQTIDLIAMLEEKTRGNVTEKEANILSETLFQLRMAFVEAAK